MEDVFRSFWSAKRQLDRRDKLKILAGCVEFNQEMRDKFEIDGRDAGSKKITVTK